MRTQLLLLILLGAALAAPSTDLKASGGVIYNDAAYDLDSTHLGWDTMLPPLRAAVMEHRILGLTFEIRAVTVPDSTPPYLLKKYDACMESLYRFPGWNYAEERWDWYRGTHPRGEITETKTEWWLYVVQTTPDTVRRFRVHRIEVVK